MASLATFLVLLGSEYLKNSGVLQYGTTCVTDCHGEPFSLRPICGDCRAFAICAGETIRFSCSASQVYDYNTGKCVSSSILACSPLSALPSEANKNQLTLSAFGRALDGVVNWLKFAQGILGLGSSSQLTGSTTPAPAATPAPSSAGGFLSGIWDLFFPPKTNPPAPAATPTPAPTPAPTPPPATTPPSGQQSGSPDILSIIISFIQYIIQLISGGGGGGGGFIGGSGSGGSGSSGGGEGGSGGGGEAGDYSITGKLCIFGLFGGCGESSGDSSGSEGGGFFQFILNIIRQIFGGGESGETGGLTSNTTTTSAPPTTHTTTTATVPPSSGKLCIFGLFGGCGESSGDSSGSDGGGFFQFILNLIRQIFGGGESGETGGLNTDTTTSTPPNADAGKIGGGFIRDIWTGIIGIIESILGIGTSPTPATTAATAATSSPATAAASAPVGCDDSCAGRLSGLFNKCGNCTVYVQCNFGIRYVMPCPATLVFDSAEAKCLRTSNTCR